jgi:SPP1 gp7 family putative phage head morphogenesis protein
VIRLPTRFKATTDPWAGLLADKQFWADFRADLERELAPLFLGIFAAGAMAAATIKPRREKALPSPELEAFLDIDALVALGERTIGDYANKFSKTIADDTFDQVRAAVITSRRTGTGVEGVLKDITPLFSSRRAEVIAVTETTRLFGMGAQAIYRAQGFDGWEWMTVNDPRVDPACASMTGITYPMDQEFEPKHPSCRCFPSPVATGGAVKQAQMVTTVCPHRSQQSVLRRLLAGVVTGDRTSGTTQTAVALAAANRGVPGGRPANRVQVGAR